VNLLCKPLRQRRMLFEQEREGASKSLSCCGIFTWQIGRACVGPNAMVLEQTSKTEEASIICLRQTTIE
jgi:hypothetical protein